MDDIFGIMMNPAAPMKLGLSMLADNLPLKTLTGPEYDILETADTFKVLSDLPGYAKDNINVDIRGKQLTITALRQSEVKQDTDMYHRIGRSFGKVTKIINLPDNVDEEHTSADFKNGVLTLTFPKKNDDRLVRNIPIKD